MKTTEINCTTGEITERPMTPAEIAQVEADAAAVVEAAEVPSIEERLAAVERVVSGESPTLDAARTAIRSEVDPPPKLRR